MPVAVRARRRAENIAQRLTVYDPRARGALYAVENEAFGVGVKSLRVENDGTKDEKGHRKPLPGASGETYQSMHEWSFAHPTASALSVRAMCMLMRLDHMQVAASRGLAVVATGTPLSEPEGGHQLSTGERIDEFIEDVGEEDLDATLTAAQHVHVDIGDLDVAIEVINRIRPWLAVLDALMVNSPIRHGRFEQHASQRMMIYPTVSTYRENTPYYDSIADWEAEALEFMLSRGIDRNDLTRVHDVVRPAPRFLTVEPRGADVPLTADGSEMHALLIQALVKTALIEIAEGRPPAARPDPSFYEMARRYASTHGVTKKLMNPRTERPDDANKVLRLTLDYMKPGFAANGTLPQSVRLLSNRLEFGSDAEKQLAMLAAINTKRKELRLDASDLGAVLNGEAEIDPGDLADLTFALVTQTACGTLTNNDVIPRDAYSQLRHFVGDPVHSDRLARLSDLTISSGFGLLEDQKFSFAHMDGPGAPEAAQSTDADWGRCLQQEMPTG